MPKIQTRLAQAAAAMAAFALAACGTQPASTPEPSVSAATSAPASPSASTSSSGSDATARFGPGCASMPTGIEFDGFIPAAVRAPDLGTLVILVRTATLTGAWSDTKDITIFAPTNDAFAAAEAERLSSGMKDPKGLLTDILNAHVVTGTITPEQLAGSHQSWAEGETIAVEGSGETFTVNGDAKILCGNVQTGNATVYVVDKVLMPKA